MGAVCSVKCLEHTDIHCEEKMNHTNTSQPSLSIIISGPEVTSYEEEHYTSSVSQLSPESCFDGVVRDVLIERNHELIRTARVKESFLRFLYNSDWIDQLISLDLDNKAIPQRRGSSIFNSSNVRLHGYLLPSPKATTSPTHFVDTQYHLIKTIKARHSLADTPHPDPFRFLDKRSRKSILIAVALSKFLQSEDYEVAKANSDLVMLTNRSGSTTKHSQRSRSQRHDSIQTLLANTLSSSDEEELEKLLEDERWIRYLLETCEILPFSLVISHAQSSGYYPIDYVNQAFTISTGYSSIEVLGKDYLTLLKCNDTEKDQMKRLLNSLKYEEPCKLVLTHKTKFGRTFSNFMSTRPVHIGYPFRKGNIASAVDQIEMIECVETMPSTLILGAISDIGHEAGQLQDLDTIDLTLSLISLCFI
jgi:PAS domain-containing protein